MGSASNEHGVMVRQFEPAEDAWDDPAEAETSGSERHGDDRRARYDTNKLHKRLRRQVGQAITEFGMIEAGDRVMVCPAARTRTPCSIS